MKLKKAGIITKIIIIVLVVYAAVTIVSITNKTADIKAEQEALRQQVIELELQNAELQYSLEHSDDDEVIAEIAREELGLVGADEKVFYDSDN